MWLAPKSLTKKGSRVPYVARHPTKQGKLKAFGRAPTLNTGSGLKLDPEYRIFSTYTSPR